jgi:uncharacterized protein YdeI (YjbR/CyaY-like superfamily)
MERRRRRTDFREHHDKEDEFWIKIHKVDSGLKSFTPKEAIDVMLCWCQKLKITRSIIS